VTGPPSTLEPLLVRSPARPLTAVLGPSARRTVRSGAPTDRWARRVGRVLIGVASVVLLGDLGS
jgi:hypothetical protein